jgi:stringent starvation protein B
MTQLLPPKKEVALALLERSNVDVYLDPRAQGVVVPPQFRKEPRLILKIGLNMPVPIPDLRLDDESMSCTLSFNRVKFYCVVPWLSVFAMVGDDGRGMVWPDDVPQELAVRVVDERGSSPGGAAAEDAPASSRGGERAGAKGKVRLQIQPDASRDSERREGEATRAAEGGPPPKSKRPRKKKERELTRPVLVAVPPPKKSSPKVEKLDDRRENGPRIATSETSGAVRPERPSSPERIEKIDKPGRPVAPAPVRPKRELPPYLRVVK